MAAQRQFKDLHALARRVARRSGDADDLVQQAILAALEAGRSDLTAPETRRWLAGVIRKRAAFDARTAGRSRRREIAWSETQAQADDSRKGDTGLPPLSPALKVTALLALSGHTRQEIGWLLNLSDTALRQRISQLRKALANASPPGSPGPDGELAFGRIRRALLAPARRDNAFLASHDPDGHLFVISRSQFPTPRQQTGG
jgi:DNA-directed RNA polymerase specialized sigma24 family protein